MTILLVVMCETFVEQARLADEFAKVGMAQREHEGETSAAASITKGFPANLFASKESAMGTSTVGMVVVPPWIGSRPARV